jgi:hypothetical protein
MTSAWQRRTLAIGIVMASILGPGLRRAKHRAALAFQVGFVLSASPEALAFARQLGECYWDLNPEERVGTIRLPASRAHLQPSRNIATVENIAGSASMARPLCVVCILSDIQEVPGHRHERQLQGGSTRY